MVDGATLINLRAEEHRTPTLLRPTVTPFSMNTTAPWDPMIPKGPSGWYAMSFPIGIAASIGTVAGESRSTGQDATSHRRAKSR
jgi:hypothetical protein